jgi:hypothetical protein
MTTKMLGVGFAPDVAIINDFVYVAYGMPGKLMLVALTLDGREMSREELPGGFEQSYPRFDVPWLVYRQREAWNWAAVALHLFTRQLWSFGPAGGTYCLAANAALGLCAWEEQRADGWRIWFGHLVSGTKQLTRLPGAPDGIDQLVSLDQVTLRKDTRQQVPGMFHPVRAGDLTVGERPDRYAGAPPEGTAAVLDGEPLRIAWLDQDTPTPRCATNRSIYALVTGGAGGVRLWLGTRADVQALPEPSEAVRFPTFAFDHPVLVAPFKDSEGTSGAPAEIVVNGNAQAVARPYFAAEDTLAGPFLGELLGIYSESSLNPTAALGIADRRHTRLLLCHDSATPWTPPAGLRPWDVPCLELYWYAKGETLDQARFRWSSSVQALVNAWPGDCGVVPMFYCMGGAPPDEVLTVAEVLDALASLSLLVNLSPRIKVIAPFSYQRANGIVAHPELRKAFNDLLGAAQRAGMAVLHLVPAPVPAPSTPPIPTSLYHHAKEYIMSGQTEIGAIKGPGNKFGRVVQADAGRGPFGWYPVLFDRDTPDDDCWFELSQSDTRHQLRHTKVDGILGADATEHSTDIPHEFYLKPGVDRGILESPVLIHDPASALIVGYFTWPEKAVAGPAFVWVKQ